MNDTTFDQQKAHRRFAAACFNEAWNLLDKTDRTADDDLQLVRLVHASHWHWTQVEGATRENFSIGYWQTARVYAVLGQADNARRYAAHCLEVSSGSDVEPFYLAYAHEAAARAAALAGDVETMRRHHDEAARIAETLSDEASRTQLQADLETIG
ncbi:MAG: hypothetical protein R3C10_01285 [Pirellulales bacterium]